MKVLYWVCLISGWTWAIMMTPSIIKRAKRRFRGMNPLRVYVAGPLTRGDVQQNIQNAIAAADILRKAGYMPYVPHLTWYWDESFPHDYEHWMTLDFAYLDICDAVVRIPGESPGADREVQRAKERGIPVLFGIEEFLKTHGNRRG